MATAPAPIGAAALAADRSLLQRASTAERLAAILRARIMEGTFPPGGRLPEDAIGSALGVSRNTLREAFRLLAHERLVVHQLNRGTFVAAPGRADVVDLYRVRRLLEVGAVLAPDPDPVRVRALAATAEEGRRAAAAGDWREVATADLRFHSALAALAGSDRVDETMRCLLAELRLVFGIMGDPGAFHRRYLSRNRRIARLVAAGRRRDAADELGAYLGDAEAELLTAYDRRERR